jgi:hypothetical protein
VAIGLGLFAPTAVAGHAAPSANARLFVGGSPGMVLYVSPAGTGDPRHVKTATGIRCTGQCSRFFPVGTKVTIRAESKRSRERAAWDSPRRDPVVDACKGRSVCSFAMPGRIVYLKTFFCPANLNVAQCRAYIDKSLGRK